jgi:O-antigen/teichoic acid export membrane protein
LSTASPSLGPQIAALFVGRTLALAAAFATPLVLVRIFSQGEYGLYKQLFLVQDTLASLLTVGLAASLYYFIPSHPTERHAFIVNTVLALAVLGALGGGALVVFRHQVVWLLNNPQIDPYLPYLGGFIEFSLVASILEGLMVVAKQARLAALTAVISEGLRAAMVLAGAMWMQQMKIVVAALLVWAACRVSALFVYLRWLGVGSYLRPHWEHFGTQLRYSIPFGLALIVRTGADGLHQYLVAHLYGPVLFAIYSVGYLQIPLVAIAFESTTEVVLVRLTELRRDGMLDQGPTLVRDAIRRLAVVLLPLYVWLMVNAHEVIVLLYTERFEPSVPLFRVFLAMIPLTVLALDYIPRAFADTGFILRVNLFRLATNLILLAVLWPLGVLGMALATVGATAVSKFAILLKARALFGVTVWQLVPGRRLANIALTAGLAALAAGLARAALASGPGVGLSVSLATFSVCYGGTAWLGGLLEPTEKRWLAGLVGSVARAAGMS